MSGVEIRVRADSRQARQDLNKLERSVSNIEKSAFNVGKAFKSLAISGAFVLSLRGITRSLSQATDSFTNLENRIALVTGRGAELDRTLRKLSQVSASTRVGLNTTAETFNRFGLALADTKVSADELLEVTRTINQAVKISGASAESARAAIIQFGQGLASGQLRGQELNSVLEQTPRIARAIADGIGIPFGQLRDAAAEGKLTTDAVLRAIQKAAPEIRAEFALIRETIEDVSLRMRSQFQRAIRVLADESGWADFIIRQMKRITFAFQIFADVAPAYLQRVRAEFFALGNSVSRALKPITDAFADIRESLSAITTGEFDADAAVSGFKSSWTKFTTEARKLIDFSFIDEETKNFDFQGFFNQFTIPESFRNSFNSIEAFLQNFSKNIREVYDLLFGKTQQSKNNSLITPISFNSQEVNVQKGLFDQLLDTMTKWSGSVISLFLSVKETLKPIFEFITKASEGAVQAFKDSEFSVDGLSTRLTAITSVVSSLGSTLDEVTGASSKIRSIQDILIGDNSAETSLKIKKIAREIDEAIFGQAIGNEKDGTVGGILENGIESIKNNPLLTGAAAGALGLSLVFPETTLAALKLAGIGFGLAAVQIMAKLFDKGLPILLLIGGIKLLPNADDKEAQARIKSIGENLAAGIKGLFSEETLEEGDVGAGLFNNLGEALSSLGEGILEGIFDADFEGGITTAVVGAISAGLIAAAFGLGPARLAFGALGTAIIGGIKGSKSWTSFKSGFTDELFGTSATYGPKVEKVGKQTAKAFRAGFGALVVGELSDQAFEGIAGEADSTADKFARSLTKGALQGITAAASTGIGANPIVLFAAALAGAVGQAIYLVFTDTEIQDQAYRLGQRMYDGFKDAFFGRNVQTADDAISVLKEVQKGRIDPSSQTARNAADFLQNSTEPNERQKGEELRGSIIDADILDKLTTRLARLNKEEQFGGSAVSVDRARFQYLTEFARLIERSPIEEQPKLLKEFNDQIIKFNNLEIMSQKLQREINALGRDIFITLSGGVATAMTSQVKSQFTANTPKATPFSTGGMVTGSGGGTDDKIPTMLSNGEYVLRASAVNKFGVGFLNAINQGYVPQKRAGGGLITTEEALSDDYWSDNNPLSKGPVNIGTIYNRLLQVEPLLNSLGGYSDNLRERAKKIAELTATGRALNKSEIYYPDPAYDYLLEFATNNPIGNGNKDREIVTDPFKFIFPEIDHPFPNKTVPNFPNIFTDRFNYEDMNSIMEFFGGLNDFATAELYDVLGINDFTTVYRILGDKLYDTFQGGSMRVIDSLSDIMDVYYGEDIIARLYRKPELDYGDYGFDNLDDALVRISGYTGDVLKNHAFKVVKQAQAVYSGFFGKRLDVYEDAYVPGDNAHFWRGENANSPAHLALMSFDTDNPYSFLAAYFSTIHEVGHALDFLKDTANFRDMTKWPKGDPYIDDNAARARLLNETDANMFTRNNSLVNMNPDIVDTGVAFSQMSYVEAFLLKALRSNSKLLQERPAILSVLKDNYDLDLQNISPEFSKYFSELYGEKERLIGGKLNVDQEDIDWGRKLWEETLLPSIQDALFTGPVHKEKFNVNKDNVKKFARGGYVTGEGGPTDDKIPALLSNREFVVNAASTDKYRPLLEAINNGTIAKFAGGTPSSNSASSGKPPKLSVIDQNRIRELNLAIEFNKGALDQVARTIQIYSKALFNADENSIEAANAQDELSKAYFNQRAIQNQIVAYEGEIADIRKESAKAANAASRELNKVNTALEALKTSGNEAAKRFKNGFETALNELFKKGDLGAFGDAILDSFTSEVISSFSKGMTDMLFDGLIGTADKDGKVKTPKILDKIFGGSEDLGRTGDVSKDLQTSTGEFMNIFKIIPKFFGGLFETLSTSISTLFSGLTGGGGFNPFSLFSSLIGGPVTANQGGIVPSTPFSQVGKDSVPAMLTPGEMVIPADKVRSMNSQSNRNQTVVNLSITGDVSRQTRQEIVKMLPTIASGVNAQNKERNYKYR